MNSSEFHTEHIQPTIEYGGPAENVNTTREVPEVVIVAETEDTTEAVEEFDTSTILASDDRDGYEDNADQSTSKQPLNATETVEEGDAEEVKVEEPATEQVPPTRDETEVIIVDAFEEEERPLFAPRQMEISKRERDGESKTIVEIAVEKLLEYLDRDIEDEVAKAVAEKPEPAAAAEVPVEAVKEVTPEVEEPTAADIPEVVEADLAVPEVEAPIDPAVGIENVVEEGGVPEEIVFVDPALGEVAVSGGLPGEVKGDGNSEARAATDIRELAEQSTEGVVQEAVAEAAEEVDTVASPQSPLAFVLAQLPTDEATVNQPVAVTGEEAVPAPIDEVIVEPEIGDDVVREAEPTPATYSPPQAEAVEPVSTGEGETFSPVVPQQVPKLGPEFPSYKPEGRLTRILEGIGTTAAVVGAVAAAGVSAGTLPARVAMTKIDDRQVKQEGFFTYKITVQGGGKSQTITVNSPFGKTFAKFRARVKFARDNLAP